MVITEKIKRISYFIATAGTFGEKLFGGVLSSLLAIPLLFVFASAALLGATIFYWIVALACIFVLIVTQWAFQYNKETAPKAIVLDKIIGLLVALVGVPFQAKVIVFAFVVFHLVNEYHVFRFYRRITEKIEKLPGVLGVLIPDIVSGLLVNGIIQLMFWVVR